MVFVKLFTILSSVMSGLGTPASGRILGFLESVVTWYESERDKKFCKEALGRSSPASKSNLVLFFPNVHSHPCYISLAGE